MHVSTMCHHGLLHLFKDVRAVADSLTSIQEEMICFRFEILHEWNKEKDYSMQLAANMLHLSFITPSQILVPVTKSNKLAPFSSEIWQL